AQAPGARQAEVATQLLGFQQDFRHKFLLYKMLQNSSPKKCHSERSEESSFFNYPDPSLTLRVTGKAGFATASN
ncbi:MAG TPA: hypothetical protein VE082_00375, partial [Desulfobaccales bacterium]|nr:hypothetical protein [Desulfobaccales bacterium]